MVRATFMPRPPPPKAALMAIGHAVLLGERDDLVGVLDRFGGAGDQRGLRAGGDVAGGDLVAEVADRLRARPDPDQPGVDDGLREVGVLARGSRSRGGWRWRRTSRRRRGACRRPGRTRRRSGRPGRTPRRRGARAVRRHRVRRTRPRWPARRPWRPGSPGRRSRHGWRRAPWRSSSWRDWALRLLMACL